MSRAFLIFAIFLAGFPLRAQDAPDVFTRETLVRRIHEGIARLNARYWSPPLSAWLNPVPDPVKAVRSFYDGRNNPPWWPSANAVETLIDFMNETGGADYDADLEAFYDLRKNPRARTARIVADLKEKNQWSPADEVELARREEKAAARLASPADYYSDFQNEYLDDSGWWAIAWLKMHDRTHAAKYLATARTIHAHMAKNWEPALGGGVLWCEAGDRRRPNAITNSLFLILSARLFERTHEPAYLEWAEKTLAWFRTAALYDGIAVVDGLGHRDDYWSYNQGAFIGGLTALHLATGRTEYLEEAAKVAGTVLHQSGLILPDGVLFEKIGVSGDASLFKGILARYLAQLREALQALQARRVHPDFVLEIDRCLRASAASMIEHGTDAGGFFRAEWQKDAPLSSPNFNSQVSGLAALVALLSTVKP